ncbi:MAG: hypothetical protein L0312_20100 [Acidobacteria bacterium]|nr:hypothetical protein [Acidobacteriota bacterium]
MSISYNLEHLCLRSSLGEELEIRVPAVLEMDGALFVRVHYKDVSDSISHSGEAQVPMTGIVQALMPLIVLENAKTELERAKAARAGVDRTC